MNQIAGKPVTQFGIIEESVLVNSDLSKVWKTFTDLTCWEGWNTVASSAASGSGRLTEGERFAFCLRPFSVPVMLEPKIEEVAPREKVVWTASKFGISSRHEFMFRQADNGVLVTSREEFHGLPLLLGGRSLTRKVGRDLVAKMLQELKTACEAGAASSS